ncbi:bifunctional riboflavin kinase/FAD synthetase [Dokdonella sp.]|uniref:bifunctional riboflavin kinase/FAD synthetase n=1 Tax=Dokdonella sp. TaxID=2291710 RepID=UPI001B2DA19E|nr:bifunctional riboflavin kinase/FAD synthetase [Dokdonella sp.]MBO9662407.1 bifunctional riboflavin kinase/FAD synthetase [Dokdonella sp.]
MGFLFRDAAGPSLAPGGSVACVGAFDGVHLGHRALLARVRERAAARGLAPMAVSFEPIPREFFARGTPVPRLASAREKIAHLRSAEMSALLSLRFDAALAAMSAESFVEDILLRRCGVRELWVGADFRFGHARRGDVALLRELGTHHGFEVGVMDDLCVDGERVSSSAIRAHLSAGEFEPAAHLLGRRFAIGGHVVRGQQLGRKLGYPTANLRLGRRTSPVGGIFAVRVHGVDARSWPGVASLGVRPTVDGSGEPLLEAHLFDFDGDLYGRRIEVEFVRKLRDELKFDDLDAMVRQIDRDAEQARGILVGDEGLRRPGESRDPAPI